MLKRLPLLLTLMLAGGVQASVQPPATLDAYRAQSRASLDALLADGSLSAARDRAILAVVQAPSDGVAEQTIEALAAYREQHPDDLYAKMYEGYGWLFTAGEYVKKQNYFRAAELAKRGFFLIDEAVDQQPDDWRLRFLRARLDVYVPAEFGRHVVALKDLDYLRQRQGELPASLAALIDFLQIRALDADGQQAQAEQLREQLRRSPVWAELLQQPAPSRLFLTSEEIQYVLAPIVEGEQ
ncbi:hypothetical protein [Aquipseudomonas guryensis]|jgi:hypothetical protein|uniref:Uncharacterized protein n=1 Tax=Aquipseudomonas guryensis TaxID=2759165 RepID=A0A7W4DCL7_9GAMM|nr:hypothetical protein [Pseudomonas guryensis]MBB1520172.1 hypothetical protein [Pseudomonas guryensis]